MQANNFASFPFSFTPNGIQSLLNREISDKMSNTGGPHMKTVELLTIEDSFQICGRGVVVIPSFSVPKGWENRTGTVAVAKPDGQQYETTAKFCMEHLNTPNPTVSIDKRWRIVVLLPGRKKEDLPAGSKISVSPEVRNAILPNNAA